MSSRSGNTAKHNVVGSSLYAPVGRANTLSTKFPPHTLLDTVA